MDCTEIEVNGGTIYIDQMEQLERGYRSRDAKGEHTRIPFDKERIKQAIQPVMDMMASFQEASECVLPDEMELAMQFAISLKGETPVLRIVSSESSAQISMKYIWKKSSSDV